MMMGIYFFILLHLLSWCYNITTTFAFVIPSSLSTPISSSPVMKNTKFLLLLTTRVSEESSLDTFDNKPLSFHSYQTRINKHQSGNRQQHRHRRFSPSTNNNKNNNPSENQEYLIKQWQIRRKNIEALTNHYCNDYPELGSLAQNEKWQKAYSILCSWSKFSTLAPKQAPIAMERLIERLIQEKEYQEAQSFGKKEHDNNNMINIPIGTYNSLLFAWTNKALTFQDKQASQHALELLVKLQKLYESGNGPEPNAKSFKLVFKAACDVEGVAAGRRLLAWMEYLYKSNKNINAKPTMSYYHRLLHMYGNGQEANAGVMAESLIRQMHQAEIVQPTTISYNIAIKAWLKSQQFLDVGVAVERAEQIMNEMQVPKDIITYSTVITAWANSGMKNYAASRAEELLKRIQDDPNVSPDTVAINAVMSAWVQSENPAAVNRTLELLQYMEKESIAPDLISFVAHLNALSIHSKDRIEYAQQADELLTALEKMSDNGKKSLEPNLFCYNLAIVAWASQATHHHHDDDDDHHHRKKNIMAARNALRILKKMINRDNGIELEFFSFEKVLNVLTKCTTPDAAELADDLLQCMKVFNSRGRHAKTKEIIIGYISALVSWAERYDIPNIAGHAKQVINSISPTLSADSNLLLSTNNNNNTNGNKTSTMSAVEQLILYNDNQGKENTQKEQSDQQTERRHDGTDRQQALRDDLNQQWQVRQHYIEAMTDHFCNDYPELGSLSQNGKWREVLSILYSWSKFSELVPERSPIAMDQLVKRLLREKEYQQKTQSTEQNKNMIKIPIGNFNSLLYAWTNKALKSQDKQASKHAREILVMLQDVYEPGESEAPNYKSFNMVFKAVCEVEGVQETRYFLEWMEHLYISNKNVNAKPPELYYNWLMDKYANSQEANAGVMAEGLICHMDQTGIVQPSTYTYNIAIKAWARVQQIFDDSNGAERAQKIMHEMKERQVPKDFVTYISVISAWANSGMKDYALSYVEALLEQVEQDPNVSTSNIIINAVMSAWVKSGSPSAVKRTLELLQYMQDESLKRGNDTTIAPNLVSYSMCILALSSQSKNCYENAKQADELLTRLEEMYDNGEKSFQPNLFCYDAVVEAWASQATNNNIKNNGNQEEKNILMATRNALRVLQKLIHRDNGLEPGFYSFQEVRKLLLKCTTKPDAEEIAQDLLSCMEVYYYETGKHVKTKEIIIECASDISSWAKYYHIPNISERAEQLIANHIKTQKQQD